MTSVHFVVLLDILLIDCIDKSTNQFVQWVE